VVGQKLCACDSPVSTFDIRLLFPHTPPSTIISSTSTSLCDSRSNHNLAPSLETHSKDLLAIPLQDNAKMAHLFPSDQPGHRSGRSIALSFFWTELTQSTGGGIFTFLGAHNLSPRISSITRSTSVQQRHRVQDILPNSIRMYVLSNDKLLAHRQKHPPNHKRLRQSPEISRLPSRRTFWNCLLS
jgi:hypothetical protein